MAWEIDAAYSHARFSIRQMGASAIQGQFKAVSGYVYVDEINPSHSWVDVAVDATSIDTGDAQRDSRLRSTDVLDVAAYATITFKSVRVEHIVSQDYKVSGDLTVRGVTRPVTFDARFQGQDEGNGVRRAALAAKAKINWADFSVTALPVAEADQLDAGHLVRIDIDLALVQREAEIQRSIA
jgi:polyisoprenoid-binding protein YceI